VITTEFIDEVKASILSGNDSFLNEKVAVIEPADIAVIMEQLTEDEGRYLFKLLPKEISTDTLTELDEDIREELLETLTTSEIAAHVDEMDSDDAADLVSELPETKQEEVISQIKDQEAVEDIRKLLTYPEDSAGALMQREFIKVNQKLSVLRCVAELRRQAKDVENVYTIYVVDQDDKLVGLLSLKSLLVSTPNDTIDKLYNPKIHRVKASASKEEVARIMQKYDLVVLPVVDDEGKLLGRITIDDVVDVIKEEADKDYQMMSGLSENVESHDRIGVITRARIPWLIIALLGGILVSMVIGTYEGAISIHPEMAFFMPLIAAMGGNVGIQSSAIVVQGLADHSVNYERMVPKLLKELVIGFLNGLICSSLIFAYSYYMYESFELGATVGVALISVMIFAAIFGTFIPMILHRWKIDPAIATGPFITTTNDILGIIIYFTIGHIIYF
jgi:magnesium transporter